jgi:excisionase family DNA binding protein
MRNQNLMYQSTIEMEIIDSRGNEYPRVTLMRTKANEAESTRLLTIDQVAAAVQVCPKTVRRVIADGELRSVRVGRQIRISRSELDRYLGLAQ